MNNMLKEKILKLKKDRNAIILSHYYQRDEIQELADFVGDSYKLSEIARDCIENTIVFCGVNFMAESAKILSPHKTILLPVLDAGCPMAEMADVEEVSKLKDKHPNATVVSYINSTTEVKAISDVCVTSSSAIKIIKNLNAEEIIFLPDRNLGEYISEQFLDKNFIIWDGFCITHKKVKASDILELKELVKDVKVLVHPECEKSIRDLADFVGSTGEIINYSTLCQNKNYIIATESGILYELKKKNPNKNFYVPGKTMTCINMKKTTLEDVYNCLLNMNYEIKIEENLRVKALDSLLNMHKLSR